MSRMTGAGVLLCAAIALVQPPNSKLTFEVASIKPAAPRPVARLQGSVTAAREPSIPAGSDSPICR